MSEQEIINEVIQNLKIEHPCPMLLARMEGKEDAAFYCNSCEKKIVDFRDCSQAEIVAGLKSGTTCGIFYEDQLGGQDQVQYNIFQKAAFYALIICSFIGMNVQPLQAQSTSRSNVKTDRVPMQRYSYKTEKTVKKPLQLSEALEEIPEKTKKEAPAKKVKKKRRRYPKWGRRKLMGCPVF